MKKIGQFVMPLLFALVVVILGGNQAMAQMTALVGEDYSQVLAIQWEGETGYVDMLGQRRYFDAATVQNAIYQIKSTIQSAAHGVKYGIDRR